MNSTVGAKESLSDYFAAITTSGRNISDVYSIRWTKYGENEKASSCLYPGCSHFHIDTEPAQGKT